MTRPGEMILPPGSRLERCPDCREVFSCTRAGDRHRTGDHGVTTGPNRRRCRTVPEMEALGMERNARGVWTTGGGSYWSGKVGRK